MKALGVLAVLCILSASALAYVPNFAVQKQAVVTGDWAWDGAGWVQGSYPTASFNMDAKSWCATSGYYVETEAIGQPWKYDLQATVGFNKPGKIANEFHAWTVNDPATTPATGGYTKYSYSQNNFADFSASSLSVSGQGAVDVSTLLKAKSAAQQDIIVDVN